MTATLSSHHTRTERILLALDAARVQREKNDSMRNGLLDAEDLLEELHEQLLSQRMHEEIADALHTSDTALGEYEAELSYSDTSKKHPPARYMADCNLQVPLSELTSEDSTESLRAVTFGLTHLNKLRDSDPMLRDFFERAIATLERAAQLVEEAKIESDPWLHVLEPVVALLERIVAVRDVGDALGPLSEQIARLNEADSELRAQQAAAETEGEVARCEELMGRRITVLEGVSDLITERFRLLDAEECDRINVFSLEVRAVEAAAKAALLSLRSKAAARRQTLEGDLLSLQRESERARTDESLARGSFERDIERSNELLTRNKSQQDGVWAQIHDLNRQLVELARQRREEVGRRVKLIEREERRRVDMRHFTAFAEEHERLLMATISTCQSQDLLGDAMEEVIAGACGAISRKLRALSKATEELRTDALDQHLTTFHAQYATLGELMYKTTRRREELQRRVELATAQQEAAMDSLNPAARGFAIRRSEIAEELQLVDERLALFRDKASLYVEAFKPSERALVERNRTFEHPVQRLAALNKERGRKLGEFYALALQPPQAKPSMTAVELEQERREIETLRNAVQRLKC